MANSRYKVGDAYISMAQEDAVTQLEQDTQRADKELARLQKVMDECESGMNELKVALYAKFGSNISTSPSLSSLPRLGKLVG